MRPLRGTLVGIVALGALVATTSQASPISSNYTGSIVTGVDGGGFFGPSGADLAGDTVSVTYQWDDSFGIHGVGLVNGGSQLGTQSPLLSVAITINGATYTESDFSIDGLLANVLGKGDHNLPIFVVSYSDGISSSSRISMYFQSPIPPAAFSSGPGAFSGISTFCVHPCGSFELPYGTYASDLDIGSFSVVGQSARVLVLPEPANWALMLSGLGLAGGTLRRRRKHFASAGW